MANPDVLAAGATLLHYTLQSRIGDATGNVWKATDSRSSKIVALKILSRHLPKDKTRREALVRDIRLAAAVSHPFLAAIHDINTEGDVLLMATELVEGESISARVAKGLPSRVEFLKWTYQICEALGAIHARGSIHGRINGDNILITPDGAVRLVGLGMTGFGAKRGDPSEFQETSSGLSHGTYYLSPEQIVGRPLDIRSDFFSLGCVLYEMGTGKLPFQGKSLTELAASIVKASAPSPHGINPKIDGFSVTLIGKCLYKDASMRYGSTKIILGEIKRAEPKIPAIAAPPAAPTRAAAESSAKQSIVFIGELPFHEMIRKKDPDRASHLEAMMQQILGEAAYLFDGQVLDSFGPRMIAEMPEAAGAVSALRKALADVLEHNATHAEEAIEPRMIVHSGELEALEGGAGGAAVDFAARILGSMEPMQILISEGVFFAARNPRSIDPVSTIEGLRFYALPPEPKAPPKPAPVEQQAEEAGRNSDRRRSRGGGRRGGDRILRAAQAGRSSEAGGGESREAESSAAAARGGGRLHDRSGRRGSREKRICDPGRRGRRSQDHP
jgi:tRNA A-37 threonylcarbamoyl transferase component Bud32